MSPDVGSMALRLTNILCMCYNSRVTNVQDQEVRKMIYVLGSINTDMVAAVPYMPENGETLSANKFFINCGGKGANQAIAIAKLGGKVAMIGKVGRDANGEVLLRNLKDNGVDAGFVTYADCPSGIAMIIVENGDNRIILSAGANYAVTKSDVDDGLRGAVPGDVLIMQLEIPMEIVNYAAKRAKEKGMTVILNPAPAKELPVSLTENVDIICPNESEAKILTGIEIEDDVTLALAVKALYKKGVKSVVLTMGAKGAYVTSGNTITPIPPRKVTPVDTTGAGDTFIGALAVKLTENEDIVSAGKFASYAGSITITREGASSSIPTLEEVKSLMQAENRD